MVVHSPLLFRLLVDTHAYILTDFDARLSPSPQCLALTKGAGMGKPIKHAHSLMRNPIMHYTHTHAIFL